MSKILIADDSRFQVEMLSRFLGEKGFSVVSAVDALQAWTAALRESPSAIILDLNMPAGSGLEVLRKLRMSTKTHCIPVIAITASSEANVERTVRELGAADFLSKPIDLDRLHAILSSLLPPVTS